jgi:hypothetical protein
LSLILRIQLTHHPHHNCAQGGNLNKNNSGHDQALDNRRFSPLFSPDGRLLALNDVLGATRLVEPAREVMRLTGPEPSLYSAQCFGPDATQLIASGSEMKALYVWDLRLIRKRLNELGMDWDWPEFSTVAGRRE